MSHVDYRLKEGEYIWVKLDKLFNCDCNNNCKSNERRCITGSTKYALKGVKFKPFRYTVDFYKPLN